MAQVMRVARTDKRDVLPGTDRFDTWVEFEIIPLGRSERQAMRELGLERPHYLSDHVQAEELRERIESLAEFARKHARKKGLK